MRIAILGGAFDPIHKGHIQIAKQALKKLAIDEVWFMPSASAPLKDGHCVSFADRAEMVKRGIRPYRHMRLCTLEGELGKVSYTINTVKALQKRYPMHSFCWLIGDDQALQFDLWKNSEELKQLLPFYVFSRQSNVTLPDGLQQVTMPLIAVSSSEIRAGKKLYQLPKAVHRYIADNGLYIESMMQARLPQKRYVHSCSVATLCKELAKAHHLDVQAAYLMGMLHDVCKPLPYEQGKIYMKQLFPACLNEPAPIWHGYIGAAVASKVYGIHDRRILQAIYHHVKGRNHTDYDRILFIADKLDPSRGYDSSKEIAISMRDLKAGFAIVKQQQEAYLKQEGTL